MGHDTERFFGPVYGNVLVDWVEALNGIAERLAAGGRIVDVGCGHGAPTVRMAEAYPEATVHAVDDHGESIVVAREQAETAGVADCVDFEMATTGRTAGPTTTW